MTNIAIITPTYSGDIDRFDFLRRSIVQFAPGIPHLAIVQTEHMPLFTDRFSGQKNLEIISTADVLPKKLEWVRRAHGQFIWRIVERVAWRLYLDPNVVRGWKVQQLTKIHALRNISQKAAVFIDSDSLFITETNPDDYFKDGKTIILESSALSGEDISLDIATYMLLKKPLNTVQNYMNYVHVGATFNKATAHHLFNKLLECHSGGFESAFLQHQLPSEYNLLGYVAKNIENYEDYSLYLGDPRMLTFDIRYKKDLNDLDNYAGLKINDIGKRYLLFQSNLGVNTEQYKSKILDFLANS